MANRLYGAGDKRRLALLDRIARRFGVPLLATNDVLYHEPDRRPLQDVLTCIREHGPRHCRPAPRSQCRAPPQDAAEMARLFRDFPEAIAESARCSSGSTSPSTSFATSIPTSRPAMREPAGGARAADRRARRYRYPDGVPEKVRKTIAHELALIASRDYAPYFLTVHDIVRFARGEGILCQGRGSAANSVVCYCLGITEVEPRHAPTSSSSASSRPSGTSRPTSTSISSMSGARR